MFRKRIAKELITAENIPREGILVFEDKENKSRLSGQIIGPEKTPYEGGIFKLEIKIPE